MEFRDVVRARRMVRNYPGEPIDSESLEAILDAARRAPSAGNTQGQSFVVVTSDAGMGRSRFLDSIVLESKLLGALVLRADGSDGGELGVMRRLARELVEARPKTRPVDANLLALIDGDAITGDRERLLHALRTCWYRCTARPTESAFRCRRTPGRPDRSRRTAETSRSRT